MLRMSRYLLVMTSVVMSLALLSACNGYLAANVPAGAPSSLPTRGFTYYLSKDVVEVSADVTFRKKTFVHPDLTIESTKSEFFATSATVSLHTIADTSTPYTVDLANSIFAATDLTVTATAGGALSALNATTTGKAGDVIKNVTSFVTSVLPILGLLAGNKADLNTFFKASPVLKPFVGDEAVRQRFAALEPAQALYVSEDLRGAELWIPEYTRS